MDPNLNSTPAHSFDNLVALEFGKEDGSVDILAMFSSEKERVPLGKNLKVGQPSSPIL